MKEIENIQKHMDECIQLLNKLKESNDHQYSSKWTEEDNQICNDIIEYLECYNDFDSGSENYNEYCERFEKYIKWMNVLKNRIQK